MITTTAPASLAQALPGAEFTEHHDVVVEATPERVWTALRATRWSDLRVTLPLMAIRGLGPRVPEGETGLLIGPGGPTPVVHLQEGCRATGVSVAQPWRARPERGPRMTSLAAVKAFAEPGWLKMGMEFELHPLPGGRTRLSTVTLCEPTDEVARARFARYWRAIRPFSGLIRMDMLRAVRRRAVTR